ncbi:MAG: serine/threonine-protein kinase [Acidobacteriota bacterium]
MSELEKIGEYEVVEKIGEGSFGVVYRGWDPFLKRDVAIKVCTVDDQGLRQRFLREAEIAGGLAHENVAGVFAFGFQDDIPYMVQEFLDGQDLQEAIRLRHAWTPLEKLEILIQVAQGLAYAHSQGVIHRDVKPANLRLLPDGKVKIVDFGIARLANQESQLTQKGVTMGTASYMPPEQVRGGEVDARADLFSFGVVAYELLAGERPFRGKTISALVYQILYKTPRPLGELWPACPRELARLVTGCLDKEPAKRPADSGSVLEELGAIRDSAVLGRWPALTEGAGPDPADSTMGDGGEWLSQSLIARTAEAVEKHHAGTPSLDATLPVGTEAPKRRRDGDATQPVSAVRSGGPKAVPSGGPGAVSSGGLETVARGVPPGSSTRPLSPPPLPAVPSTPPPPTGEGSLDESTSEELLSSKAHEISRLVEQGDLQAAMAQLEETINRQGSAPGEEGTGVVARTSAAVDENLPTMELAQATGTGAPPPPTTPPVTPAAAPVPPPIPGSAPSAPTHAGRAGAPQAPPAGTPAARPQAPKGGGVDRRLISAVAVAAVVVLSLAVGWWLSSSGGRSAEETVVEAVPVPPPPSAPEPVAGPRSGLVIDAVPWAFVTEITDSKGFVQELPMDASTPFFVELPEGQYTITLTDSERGETKMCEGVRVFEGTMASCAATFAEPTSTDYFKDSGWWR